MKSIFEPSVKFHKISPTQLPKQSVPVYKDNDIEIIQSPRTLKFFYVFTIAGTRFVFWTLQCGLDYVQRFKSLRTQYLNAYASTMSTLDIPADVFRSNA